MRRTVPSPFLSLFGRSVGGAAALFAVLATASFLSSGCEDKAIGRTCELSGMPSSPNSGVGLNTALECPTRICIQPAVTSGAAVDTKPFCTAECSDDSDCDNAEKRDRNDKTGNDKRCVGGFTCAVPIVVGSLCCQKLCVCRDFLPLGYKSMSALPAVCDKQFSSCPNL